MMLSLVPLNYFSFSLVILILLVRHEYVGGCNFTSIFSFGDSLTDNGNRLIDTGMTEATGKFPYGITYFLRPTGRSSDGRIVLDFMAQGLGLPLLEPYLATNGDGEEFRHGVNLAVASATVHENDFFREMGIDDTSTEYNLATQIDWFKNVLSSLTSKLGLDRDSSEILSRSLILMGEIGGDDYNHPLKYNIPVDQIRPIVPEVIDIISSAIRDLIQLGARTLVVPGITPIGCSPRFLSVYGKNTPSKADYYDPTGCVEWLNELARYHNGLLRDELNRIRPHYPDATIIYADFYEAYMTIFRAPRKYGFEKSLEPCCGGRDPSNPFSEFLSCGDERAHLCNDPSSYISWDGHHYTEAVYRIVANGLLDGAHTFPSTVIRSYCSPEQISAY